MSGAPRRSARGARRSDGVGGVLGREGVRIDAAAYGDAVVRILLVRQYVATGAVGRECGPEQGAPGTPKGVAVGHTGGKNADLAKEY
ncbi:hypothetical protein, partial [Streptomyces mirabilis]|uniref:hypothetical protein n=1 Tax=Streptomyces mirabilis TaxID=68239 RepID=UPI00333397E6